MFAASVLAVTCYSSGRELVLGARSSRLPEQNPARGFLTFCPRLSLAVFPLLRSCLLRENTRTGASHGTHVALVGSARFTHKPFDCLNPAGWESPLYAFSCLLHIPEGQMSCAGPATPNSCLVMGCGSTGQLLVPPMWPWGELCLSSPQCYHEIWLSAVPMQNPRSFPRGAVDT